ncbi:Soluble cytochrome b558 [bacterium HR34]|nr:Soluble cytochrome b558 [bacterium HR34]
MSYKIISIIAVVIIIGVVLIYVLRSGSNETEQVQTQENPVIFEGQGNELDQNQGEQEFLAGEIYSFEEIQKHNTRDDCWLVINGKVYDVTDFLNKYPEGDAILQNCGKDATEIFDKENTEVKTLKENLENYYIGDVGK